MRAESKDRTMTAFHLNTLHQIVPCPRYLGSVEFYRQLLAMLMPSAQGMLRGS